MCSDLIQHSFPFRSDSWDDGMEFVASDSIEFLAWQTQSNHLLLSLQMRLKLCNTFSLYLHKCLLQVHNSIDLLLRKRIFWCSLYRNSRKYLRDWRSVYMLCMIIKVIECMLLPIISFYDEMDGSLVLFLNWIACFDLIHDWFVLSLHIVLNCIHDDVSFSPELPYPSIYLFPLFSFSLSFISSWSPLHVSLQ